MREWEAKREERYVYITADSHCRTAEKNTIFKAIIVQVKRI